MAKCKNLESELQLYFIIPHFLEVTVVNMLVTKCGQGKIFGQHFWTTYWSNVQSDLKWHREKLMKETVSMKKLKVDIAVFYLVIILTHFQG